MHFPMVTKSKAAVKKTTRKKGKEENNGDIIVGDGAYPLVLLDSIKIVERPEDGDTKQVFFNPRSLESFKPETMQGLRESIRDNGLLQPPIVRAVYNGDEDTVVGIELIAGERRLRSIKMLVENNEDCYDKDSDEFVPAKDLYSRLPCNIQPNIDDERALRLACDENGKSEPLTIAEQIALVERLLAMGYKQDKIAEMIGEHDSWVSHTRNFRTKLPEKGFAMLLDGRLARHVAVKVISFKEEDREKLLDSSIEAEAEATQAKLEQAQDEIDAHDDSQMMAERDKEKAEAKGDKTAAQKAQKAADAAEKKKEKAKAKKDKVTACSGNVTQGDLAEGARKAGVCPKKPKQLSKIDIAACIVEPLDEWISEGYEDEDVTEETLLIIRAVAVAIAEGERDPTELIHKAMVATGAWVEEGEDIEDIDEDDEALRAAQEDFEEEDFDEDDEYFDEDDGF